MIVPGWVAFVLMFAFLLVSFLCAVDVPRGWRPLTAVAWLLLGGAGCVLLVALDMGWAVLS